MTDENTAVLLARTNLGIPLEDFLDELAQAYPDIGQVTAATPIMEGYEDANFMLTTTSGKYVVKIFLKDRSLQNCQDYVRVLQEARAIGVPVLEVVPNPQGLLAYAGPARTPYMITRFYEGQPFSAAPVIEDITQIASHLSTLNTLDFPVAPAYDSWGVANFLREYDQAKSTLTPEQDALLASVADKMRALDLAAFSQAVIHGDLQRKHVLKNNQGEYCILDFGCMANGAKVVELAIYLAWFCLSEENWKDRDSILQAVLAVYTKQHPLSPSEIAALPLLVQASYAAYYLETTGLIQNGDSSGETVAWHHAAKQMLELTSDWVV